MYERKEAAGNASESIDGSGEKKKRGFFSSSNIIMRTKEIPDLDHIRKKLELKRNQTISPPNEEQVSKEGSNEKSPRFKGIPKFKFLSKNVGHSKIIGKMMELQESTGVQGDIDEGTLKLCDKANAESEYLNVYKSGEVDSKVKQFEVSVVRTGLREMETADNIAIRRRSQSPSWARQSQDTQTFSWSKRLGATSPTGADAPYTNAQKQNMYRRYYGYSPGETELSNQEGHETYSSLKTIPDSTFIHNRSLFEGGETQLARVRSRDALISPRPYSRGPSQEKELISSNFELNKTHSLPRKFTAKAEPLVAPGILRASQSKLDAEGALSTKTKTEEENKGNSENNVTFSSLPPDSTTISNVAETKGADSNNEKSDNGGAKSSDKEEPIYGKILNSSGKNCRKLVYPIII